MQDRFQLRDELPFKGSSVELGSLKEDTRGLISGGQSVVVRAGALDSEVATETVLSGEGLEALCTGKVTLALVNRSLVALEIMLAREGLAAVGVRADEGTGLLGVVGLLVGVQVEETGKATVASGMVAGEALGRSSLGDSCVSSEPDGLLDRRQAGRGGFAL